MPPHSKRHQVSETISFKAATLADARELEKWVRAYYKYDGIAFESKVVRPALLVLLKDPEVWPWCSHTLRVQRAVCHQALPIPVALTVVTHAQVVVLGPEDRVVITARVGTLTRPQRAGGRRGGERRRR